MLAALLPYPPRRPYERFGDTVPTPGIEPGIAALSVQCLTTKLRGIGCGNHATPKPWLPHSYPACESNADTSPFEGDRFAFCVAGLDDRMPPAVVELIFTTIALWGRRVPARNRTWASAFSGRRSTC